MGGVMSLPTRSQLIAENTSLRESLDELKAKMASFLASNGSLTQDERTERERLNAELMASEIRYRRLFETAKDGILILNADSGVIIDVNPFLENMLGYPAEEIIGKALWQLGPFQDIASSQEAFHRLQNTEYSRYENLPLETKAGEFREVEFISNVYGVNGAQVIQCNIRDITERKRAEAQLRQANEELSALVSELRKRDAEMSLLSRMNDLFQACKSQEEANKVIALMAGELFAGQGGCLAISDPGSTELEQVAHWGEETGITPNFSMDDCWAIRRGQTHVVQDPEESLLCRHFTSPPKTGYLCIPLNVQGESMGLLCLMDGGEKTHQQRINQRTLATTLGEAIKLSLYNLRLQADLREQAIRDPLTGLFNRRYLEVNLDRELHRLQRSQSSLSLVMFDLDHFKRFNDHYGHDAGDLMLCELAKVIQSSIRQSDIFCRYGGEEFVLVFPDSSLEDTTKRMAGILAVIKGLKLQYENKQLATVTASAGIATTPEHGSTMNELIRAADQALYLAKQAGRDRLAAYKARA